MHISIRDVDKTVFRRFRAEAVNEGLNVGAALTMAMRKWLEKPKTKVKGSILDYKATDWGKGTERTSMEVDEILYGD